MSCTQMREDVEINALLHLHPRCFQFNRICVYETCSHIRLSHRESNYIKDRAFKAWKHPKWLYAYGPNRHYEVSDGMSGSQ